MKAAAAQMAPTADLEANRAIMRSLAEEAARDGVELLVYPEEAMLLAEGFGARLDEIALAAWPDFEGFVGELAVEFDLAIIAAGYEGTGEGRPFNTIVAFDSVGGKLAHYRKLHLYDAFNYRESDYVIPGDLAPVIFSLGDHTVGLVNCYDLRFPELVRSLVDLGADVLAVSAAWVSGPMKEDHWRTLLRARAIESTAWVVAAASSSPECIGQSMIVDPLGIVRVAMGNEPAGLVHADITVSRTDEVRAILPVLENRRLNTVTVL